MLIPVHYLGQGGSDFVALKNIICCLSQLTCQSVQEFVFILVSYSVLVLDKAKL